jgi:serine/threonine protein phosphatase PrpC
MIRQLEQGGAQALWRLEPACHVGAGDSRCVACRDGQAIAMTEDHKPTDAAENERIVKVRLVSDLKKSATWTPSAFLSPWQNSCHISSSAASGDPTPDPGKVACVAVPDSLSPLS